MKYSDFFKFIPEIEKRLGYTFSDKSLLAQAFTRTSFSNEQHSGKEPIQSNEVLEFLGDSVLSLSVATMLTEENSKRYKYGIRTEFREGDFSNIKSKLSDKTNLSESIKKLGLEKFLLMGEGDIKLSIEREPSVMEDLFESIIGAVYLDSGKSTPEVIALVGRILDVSVYLHGEMRGTLGSYKNMLQEYCAEKSRRLPPPIYKLTSTGPDHEKTYRAVCYVGDTQLGEGVGKNKKAAEAEAARKTLEALKSIPEKSAKDEACVKPPVERAKAYAKAHKCPPPEYHDLGETKNSNKTRCEFAVECRFAGKREIGIGASKKEARNASIEKILAILN